MTTTLPSTARASRPVARDLAASVIAIVIAVCVLTGCGSSVTQNSKSNGGTRADAASPTGSDPGGSSTTSDSSTALPDELDTAAICNGLDLGTIRSLVGPVTLRDAAKPGDKINVAPGRPPIVARGYACGYATGDLAQPRLVIGYLPQALAATRASKEKFVNGEPGCDLSPAVGIAASEGFISTCSSVHTTQKSRYADLTAYLAIGSSSLSCQVTAQDDPLPVDAAALTNYCIALAHSLAKP